MKTFGFAGWSGSGKTTLIEKLIPLFVARGLRVSLIKHAHHTFDVDVPGKDSYRHRHAGAMEVLVTSSRRWIPISSLTFLGCFGWPVTSKPSPQVTVTTPPRGTIK